MIAFSFDNSDMISLSPLTKKELSINNFPYIISSEAGLFENDLSIIKIISSLLPLHQRMKEKTKIKYSFWGSMGLYSYLYDQNFTDSGLIRCRLNGGKNDFDIGVTLSRINAIMNDFGWQKKEKILRRGTVGGHELIDVMLRERLASFSSQTLTIKNQRIRVASPIEMIFEKVQSLAFNPERWPNQIGETKWGLDIRILKTYLIRKYLLKPQELERLLAENWQIYLKEKLELAKKRNYAVIEPIARRIRLKQITPTEGLKNYLKIRFGEFDRSLEEELFRIFGVPEKRSIENLITANSARDFEDELKGMISRSYQNISFYEAQKKAQQTYQKILFKRYLG